MTGFLSNLVRRTFEPESCMQPLLPTLFGAPKREWGWIPRAVNLEGSAEIESPPVKTKPASRSTQSPPVPDDRMSAIDEIASPHGPGIERKPAATSPRQQFEQEQQEEWGVTQTTLPARKALVGEGHEEVPPGVSRHGRMVRHPGLHANQAKEKQVQASREESAGDAAGHERNPPVLHLQSQVIANQPPLAPPREEGTETASTAAERRPGAESKTLRQDIERFYSRKRPAGLQPEEQMSSPLQHERHAPTAFPVMSLRMQAPHSVPAQLRAFRETNIDGPRQPVKPEPVVEVTIGRIEVRGSAPGAMTKAPNAPVGPDLEAYLRARSGRGRE